MEKTNRLVNVSSAYLREAAMQPVNWYVWSEEAFERARLEDKPVLVDVGASWCHWCHVMDKESYSDPKIAEIINKHFIPIKVDRDEMPEVDRELQNAASLISGEGGWPLTVFLTPDKKVFFGGTYFPPEDKYGRIGFKKLLTLIVQMWRTKRQELIESAENLYRMLRSEKKLEERVLDSNIIEMAFVSILSNIDWEFGGLSGVQKFPHPLLDQFMTAYTFRTGDEIGFKACINTLKKMCYGGIFDQVGGGFHRYTVDRKWWIPHFEKLMIDNAEIMIDLANSYLFSQDPELLDCLEMTVDYVLRDMKVNDLFANSEDADSEGVEGKYYTWTEREFEEALGTNDQLIKRFFSLDTAGGLVEGRKVLRRSIGIKELSEQLKMSLDDTFNYIKDIRKRLLEYRERTRKRPFKDENAYTYANMRIAEALLVSYPIINNDKARDSALKVINSLTKVTRRIHGGKDGILEDYASSLLALISAYEVTGNFKYIEKASNIGRELLDNFRSVNGFSQVKKEHYEPVFDSPNESGNSLSLKGLIKMSYIKPDEFSLKDVEVIVKKLSTYIDENNTPFLGGILMNIDAIINGVCHIIIIDENDGRADALHKEAFNIYHPFKIIEIVMDENKKDITNRSIKVMLNHGNSSRAYVCIGSSCSMPINDKNELRKLIKNKAIFS